MENRTDMVIQINRDSLKKIIKLQAQNKVLKKYVEHGANCYRDTDFNMNNPCTCGLDEILDDSN